MEKEFGYEFGKSLVGGNSGGEGSKVETRRRESPAKGLYEAKTVVGEVVMPLEDWKKGFWREWLESAGVSGDFDMFVKTFLTEV